MRPSYEKREMKASFFKHNGTFLIGWTALAVILGTLKFVDTSKIEVSNTSPVEIEIAQNNSVNKEAKSRFFPLMFFYSK